MSAAAARVLPRQVVRAELAETANWILIREYAIEGLRQAIALEDRGIAIDTASKLPPPERERLVAERTIKRNQLDRALQRAIGLEPRELADHRRPR